MRNIESKQEALNIAYKTTFKSSDGEMVLHDMMKNHFMLSPTAPSQMNMHEMAYNEGQRSVILRILNVLDVDLEKLREFIKKQKDQGDDYYAN
jgi:hypothetical protein